MSAENFDRSLAFVLQEEGGYSDDPQDPGGSTNLGITFDELARWRHATITKDDVRALTTDEASAIYRANYWNAGHCSDLPSGVDLMVFNAMVNTGVGRGARILQTILGVNVDGAIGPNTIAAAAKVAPAGVISAYCADLIKFYQGLPTFGHFGAGWTARTQRCQSLALSFLPSSAPLVAASSAVEPTPASGFNLSLKGLLDRL